MKKTRLDAEERALLASYDRGEWKPGKDAKQEIARLRGYARSTLAKDQRINIRMSSKDLGEIRTLAVREGIPYQTLISSVVHKYASGRLVEKKG
jgi:predicted DNA binding CopG/RHH family protein